MNIIICYATCWSCKFGECYETPTPHPWWDQDDVEYSEAVGNPAPTGNCACSCGKEAA
jgi:hypothetical protein